MKDILIITSYFPPETGAASNRIFQLATGLQKHGFKVSVITPLPNYPTGKVFKGYKGKIKYTSKENNIIVNRLWIYASNSKNKVLRLLAMMSYSISLVWFFIWNKIPNTVIIQSPPLLVAFTSMLFLLSKKRNLILNVSDLWPIAGLELGAFSKGFSYRVLEKIEKFNYSKANLVLGQSQEILNHVKFLSPRKETFLYRNFPNFDAPNILQKKISNGKLKIVYAGLLGVAQGVFKLCQELDYTNIQLHIYGAGAEKDNIENLISQNSKFDIIYYGEVSRNELHKILSKYDVTIIPLLKRIYGSVPSKIFEYARLGLPTIYFGGGEGEEIIKKYNLGWVAKAGDYTDLNEIISNINTNEINMIYKNQIQLVTLEKFDLNLQIERLIKKL